MNRLDHSDLPEMSADAAEAMRQALLDHYARTARALPWRGETDPYRVLVSEVMLQQTRVETVIPYYRRWMERFPDSGALAAATRDEVLHAWQGLGYYRRARNLHDATRVVRERHGGELPRSASELKALPGVGEYTAGAVASIAFGDPVPAVDGNVKRVLARLFDEPDPSGAWLRRVAGALVDAERPGDWNQALMDLGAMVCTPSAPECEACPVVAWCGAKRAGTVEKRPAKRASAPVPQRSFAVAVMTDRQDRLLFVRRPEDGLLGGMWAFPEEALVDRGSSEDASGRDPNLGARVQAAARLAAARAGAELPTKPSAERLSDVRHRFTHLDVTYMPVLFRGGHEVVSDVSRRWVALDELATLALPVAQQKIARDVAKTMRR